jgi:hypothetical protein
VPFPSKAEQWDGYIVIQAKCRENLRNNSQDADWLVGQLRHDLDKFLDVERGLRKPQYYIAVTNVTLSPEARSGGKVKVESLFKIYKRKLRLKGYAVWAADELRTYLENAEDVRTSYTAWLTPSDVLAHLLENVSRPNLKRLLPLALARDLRNERDVRLRDAGQETETPIYLHDVFIDLPMVDDRWRFIQDDPLSADLLPSSGALAPKETQVRFNGDEKASESEEADTTGVVANLLNRAANKLDPEAVEAAGTSLANRRVSKQLPNRIVILGGPGQGKSTIGQFLAQLARARVLQNHEHTRLNRQTRDLIGPILNRVKIEKLPLSGPARFPIRVDLPSYADALKNATDQERSLTLVSYIASRLSRETDVSISPEDLRVWLGSCPSLIVLDGLDEVPPTGNRVPVVHAIDALWDDLHHVNGDALVVVTTRPQGYNRDLDPRYWEHWELGPPSASDAMRFATRLRKFAFPTMKDAKER